VKGEKRDEDEFGELGKVGMGWYGRGEVKVS
jgi:hypothetical protein